MNDILEITSENAVDQLVLWMEENHPDLAEREQVEKSIDVEPGVFIAVLVEMQKNKLDAIVTAESLIAGMHNEGPDNTPSLAKVFSTVEGRGELPSKDMAIDLIDSMSEPMDAAIASIAFLKQIAGALDLTLPEQLNLTFDT